MSVSQTAASSSRRDFLYVATGSVAALGAAFATWPLIDQMNPNAAMVENLRIVVDVEPLPPGGAVIVKLGGMPIQIRHRTDAEIEAARNVDLDELVDLDSRSENNPDMDARDQNRASGPGGRFLVVIPQCTHLGCMLIGEIGEHDGWFCPCHGAHYDTSGRIRKGPAPQNLPVPKHRFLNDGRLEIFRPRVHRFPVIK